MEFAVQSNLMDGISEYNSLPQMHLRPAPVWCRRCTAWHAPAFTALTFQDVAEDASLFLTAVRWGVSNGIITGYSDIWYFAPAPLTREQFAVMLHRFCRIQKLMTADKARFATDASIHPYADRYAVGQRRGTDHRHARDHAVSAAHGLPRTAGDYFAASLRR